MQSPIFVQIADWMTIGRFASNARVSCLHLAWKNTDGWFEASRLKSQLVEQYNKAYRL